MHYLDALISALRDAGAHVAAAETWGERVEDASGSAWQLPLFVAAEQAHTEARARLDQADAELRAFGPSGALPALFGALPGRLADLRARLDASAERLADAAASARPLGEG